jgi:hypothetical protein
LIDFGKSQYTYLEKTKLVPQLSITALFFFFQFFWMLYKAAHINKQFEVHMEILNDNKDLLMDILLFKEFYFAEELNPHLIPDEEEKKAMQKEIRSFGLELTPRPSLGKLNTKSVLRGANSSNSKTRKVDKELTKLIKAVESSKNSSENSLPDQERDSSPQKPATTC